VSLEQIGSLEVTEEAVTFAEVPESSSADALHIAIAVAAGCEYLVTWNYRHMANAVLRLGIEDCCREQGYEPIVICTPEELMEE
jgi:predicted nucleic acid-binding protein